jgi:hypothetical protein
MMLDLARSRVAQGQLSKVERGKVTSTLGAQFGNNYDHGIMTMIKELTNEENGCRFF